MNILIEELGKGNKKTKGKMFFRGKVNNTNSGFFRRECMKETEVEEKVVRKEERKEMGRK